MLVVPATPEADATVWLFPLPAGVSDRARRSTAARALLRMVLSSATGTPPERWGIATDRDGRPRVVKPSLDHMRVSISYGDQTVALAVSERLDVGVDIEPLVPVRSDEIPWSELSPAERILLRSLPARQRYERFVRMWTLKEAFAKSSGKGASLAFSALATSLEPPGVAGPGGLVPLHLAEVQVEARRHALAVCTRAPVAALSAGD